MTLKKLTEEILTVEYYEQCGPITLRQIEKIINRVAQETIKAVVGEDERICDLTLPKNQLKFNDTQIICYRNNLRAEQRQKVKEFLK